jgi:TonB family protein
MKFALLLGSCVVMASMAHASAQSPAPAVFKAGQPGVVPPRIVSEVKPSYTPEAIRMRVQGSVVLECIVTAEGTVSGVKVLKLLHPELDAQAVKALGQWRFLPGTKDGKPVAVSVEVENTFTLAHKGPRLGSPEVHIPGASGVTLPRVVREAKPLYTNAARDAGIQGSVALLVVVLPDGTVGDARVIRSLDPGLDGEALAVLDRWRFEPGRKDGKAVPVQVTLEMTFTLR